MKISARLFVCFALSCLLVLHQGTAQAQDMEPVKGPTVADVTFGDDGGTQGFFVHVGDKNWNRLNPDRSVVSSFVEYGRDEWSVYLKETSGDATVHLNLWTKTVTQQSGSAKTELGKVLAAANTVTAATPPSTPEPTQAQDQGVPGCRPPQCLVGEVVLPPCPEGHRRGTEYGICVPDVFYHSEAGLSLGEAQTRCAKNGLVLATAEEVQAAWETLNLNVFAYGRLADGRFAVPVQTDMGDNAAFKRGTNIGAEGGNQGFFYLQAKAVSRTQEAPPPPKPEQSTTLVLHPEAPQTLQEYYDKVLAYENYVYTDDDIGRYRRLDAKYRYGNGVGNIIQDKWTDENYSPILDGALRRYIAEKFPHRLQDDSYLYDFIRAQIQNKDPECAGCRISRYEFVGFFVGEYLNALRTGSNPYLNNQLAEYVGYQNAKAARATLDEWAYYSRRGTAKLDEPYIPGLYFPNGPILVDPADLDMVPYKPNTLSMFVEADPLPGKSIDEFKECCMHGGASMSLTDEQLALQRDFMLPLAFHANPDAPEASQDLLAVPDYLYSNIEWQSHLIALAGGVGIGATAMAAVGLSIAAATSFKIAAGLTIPKIVAERVGGELVERTVQQAATIFSKEMGSKAIGPILSNAIGPILIGVAVFAAGFQNTGGKAIALAAFEDQLKRDCFYRPAEIDWNRASGGEQLSSFAWLFKLIVLESDGLTVTVPEKKADISMQKVIETMAAEQGRRNNPSKAPLYDQVISTLETRYPSCAPGEKMGTADLCVREVMFYSEPNLTLQQATDMAAGNHWELATEAEVTNAWNSLNLDVYAYGMMSDGRFAVPVRSDHPNFKIGHNMGAVGGNQGFFYTLKRSIPRGVGTIPLDIIKQTCPADREYDTGLCYLQCPEDFKAGGLSCVRIDGDSGD